MLIADETQGKQTFYDKMKFCVCVFDGELPHPSVIIFHYFVTRWKCLCPIVGTIYNLQAYLKFAVVLLHAQLGTLRNQDRDLKLFQNI